MSLITKANNAFVKVRSGLTRAAPVIHGIRKWSDAIGSVANVTPLPGAGIVRTIAKGISKADDIVQKIASKAPGPTPAPMV